MVLPFYALLDSFRKNNICSFLNSSFCYIYNSASNFICYFFKVLHFLFDSFKFA